MHNRRNYKFVPPTMENELPSRELMERKHNKFIEVLEQTEDNYNLSDAPCDNKFKVIRY